MRWQTKFINRGQSLHATTVEILKTYMVHQEQLTDAHYKKNSRDNSRKQVGQGQNSNWWHHTNNTSNPSRNSQTLNSDNKKKRKWLLKDDNCPIHVTIHKCGQCHQNQYGENFSPCRQAHDPNTSHFTNANQRSFHRTNSNASHTHPPTQVYFNHQQHWTASDNGSCLSTPSHTQYTKPETSRERQTEWFRENYYVSHSTSAITNNNNEDHLPEGTLSVWRLNGSLVSLFGLCLFNLDSTSTLINECVVPPNILPKQGENQLVTTTQGSYSSQNYFDASEIMFPEFCKTRIIPTAHICTFASKTSLYDFIVGWDILKLGFILDHAHQLIIWDGLPIPITKHAQDKPSTTEITHFSYMHTFTEYYAVDVNKI